MYFHFQHEISRIFPRRTAEIGALDKVIVSEKIGYIERRTKLSPAAKTERIANGSIDYPRWRRMRALIEVEESGLKRVITVPIRKSRTIDRGNICKPVIRLIV